jgi:hypothetical protein
MVIEPLIELPVMLIITRILLLMRKDRIVSAPPLPSQ